MVILQLLSVVSFEIITHALPLILSRITDMKNVFLASSSTQLRLHAASVVRQTLQLSHCSSLHFFHTRMVSSLLIDFTNAIFSDALASLALAQESVSEPSNGNVPDDKNVAVAFAKSLAVMWTSPPPQMLSPSIGMIIRFFAAALDQRFSEVDDYFANISASLRTITLQRLTKDDVHCLLDHTSAVLLENTPYGRSKMAKAALTRLVTITLYLNLHRIGKYERMRDVAQVALVNGRHSDRKVRLEAQLLMSVLIKVASQQQTECIVLSQLKCLGEFRDGEFLPTARDTVEWADDDPITSRQDVLGLCVSLCGALQSDPDGVAPWAPRVMERLAPFARHRNPDVRSVVRTMFTEWWKSHRDRWEFEHQRRFSPSQQEMLAELFKSPSYYV
jgi:hypothetical protein